MIVWLTGLSGAGKLTLAKATFDQVKESTRLKRLGLIS
jgi:adenylylsulfate kinase-like enzyme